MRILSVDRGSSSLKFAAYDLSAGDERRLLSGGIDTLGSADAALLVRDERGTCRSETYTPLGSASPVAALLAGMGDCGFEIDAVGHRLVFGGNEHELPARVTPELLASLDALVPFDPLHLPGALTAIREIETALPGRPQVACFDTAFHRRMPAVAQRLPLPRELFAEGVRRFGYHGLSYESIVFELGASGSRGRLIVAHLGNGASLAAMRDGAPVDTTMGFTPLGGIMMGTRPGDLDPGVLLYLLRAKRYTLAQLDEIVNAQSGLLGVSASSPDVRALLNRRAEDPVAAEALELFVYEAKKGIGSLAAVLGGLDTLVFTGGIGEHAAPLRWEIAAGLAHLGVTLDAARNAAGAPIVSAAGAGVVTRVMATNETLMVARHTRASLR